MDNLSLRPSVAPRSQRTKRAGAPSVSGITYGAAAGASLVATVPYREIAILAPVGSAKRPRADGVANLWFVRPLPAPPPSWLAPAAGLAALLVTLAVVAAFLNRAVLRPLTAMSGAARLVAAGAVDLRLPSSAAREVAKVMAALESMSADLRAALQRQASLEQERRIFIGAVAHDLRTPLFTPLYRGESSPIARPAGRVWGSPSPGASCGRTEAISPLATARAAAPYSPGRCRSIRTRLC